MVEWQRTVNPLRKIRREFESLLSHIVSVQLRPLELDILQNKSPLRVRMYAIMAIKPVGHRRLHPYREVLKY